MSSGDDLHRLDDDRLTDAGELLRGSSSARMNPTRTSADLRRMAERVSRYDDLPLGAVDASVVAVVEGLGVHDIDTLDQLHFSVVHPRHSIPAFTLHQQNRP